METILELQDKILELNMQRFNLKEALRELRYLINHNKDYTPLPQLSGVGNEQK